MKKHAVVISVIRIKRTAKTEIIPITAAATSTCTQVGVCIKTLDCLTNAAEFNVHAITNIFIDTSITCMTYIPCGIQSVAMVIFLVVLVIIMVIVVTVAVAIAVAVVIAVVIVVKVLVEAKIDFELFVIDPYLCLAWQLIWSSSCWYRI